MNLTERLQQCRAWLRMYNSARNLPYMARRCTTLRNNLWDAMSSAQHAFCLQRMEW